MRTVFLLLLGSILFISGCNSRVDSQLTELKTSVELLDTNLSAYTSRADALEANVIAIEQRLKTVEEFCNSQMSAKRAPAAASGVGDPTGAMSAAQIQTALKNAGFYSGNVDGKVGANTEKAIKEFQKANGLEPDGVIGAKTRSLLQKYLK